MNSEFLNDESLYKGKSESKPFTLLSMMELFAKIVNGKEPLIIFTKMLNHREPFVAFF